MTDLKDVDTRLDRADPGSPDPTMEWHKTACLLCSNNCGVDGPMFGSHTHGEVPVAGVAEFLGNNPWHSDGFDESRRVLKEIAANPDRSLIVIDLRRTDWCDPIAKTPPHKHVPVRLEVVRR